MKLKAKHPKSHFYSCFLGVIAVALVSTKTGSIAIALLIAYHLFYYKKHSASLIDYRILAIIASPLLLDLLFFWNNDSFYEGVKHLEKRASLLILPLLFLSYIPKLDFKKILRTYSVVFTAVLAVLFVRYIILFPELFEKYRNGIDVWQMGYSFTNSFNIHAPALNMHVAFLVTVNTYLLFTDLFNKSKIWVKIVGTILLIASLFMLFYINTRLAIVNALIGMLLVISIESFKKFSRKQVLKIVFVSIFLGGLGFFAFAKAYPFILEKYSTVTFAHMDKVGKLDDFENPEGAIYSSFVTRVSIWKTTWETAQEHWLIGVGASDGKDVLNQAYLDTDQQFLAKYKFPVHNQYLDFFLKFGVLGILVVLLYVFYILWLAYKTRSSLILCFFMLFFTSNLTDDFLIRFDGIAFSAFWISLFSVYYLRNRQSIDQSSH